MSSDEELPDIPYCPMFRTSVQLEVYAQASCSSSAASSSVDTRDNKRKCSDEEERFLQIKAQMEAILEVPKARRTPEQVKEHKSLGQKFSRMKPKFEHLLQAKKPLTTAERKSQSRQSMTDEDREEELAGARARMQREENQARDSARKQARRETMTDEDREQEQAGARARMHREENQARDSARMRAMREAMTDEDREQEKARDRARKAKTHSKAEYMAARNIEGIFDGTVIVPELKDTKDSIGEVDQGDDDDEL